ncbi:MAG: DNA polymerase III subunit gamma/tau [Muribaculaceae bacterium]|nr:DNA polymerase III subunit gamma/tau [Muribaculaceae bacterium]
MDNYIVSARKYRPATFRSVVGQKALTSTLKNAITTDRLAQAYLFCGPRGVGKTSCARIFAKTINCLNPTADGEACCECENCKAIERGTSMNVVELDAASNNSVDDIRDITDQVQTPPQGGKYRVFIIDEVHMLSSAAFNAFLKTLEEPPKYVIFILATTEKHKVLPTILSRCQTYDFRRITIEDMVEQMQYIGQQEGIKTDPRGLEVIARKADGAMRDALSIFDQVAASSRGNITYESAIENLNVLDYEYYFRLVDMFRAGDISGALLLYRDVRAKGFDSLFFLNGLSDHVRNLMVAADPRTAELLETSKDIAERYTQQATSLPLQWYYAAMKVLNDGDVQYRTATNKQFLVELVLIRLCQLLKPATPPFDLVDRDFPLGDITGAATTPQPAPSRPTTQQVAQHQRPQSSPSSQSSQSSPSSPISQSPQSASESPNFPRVRKRATGIPGFRLNDNSVQEKVAQYNEQRKEHREKVDIEGFMQAWVAYQQANRQQHILTSAMRNSTPRQTGDVEFLTMVGHPAEVQAFELAMPQLIAFLRNQLRNDFISLRVEIDPTRAVSKQLPPQEFLKECVEKNPALGELLRKLEGELA